MTQFSVDGLDLNILDNAAEFASLPDNHWNSSWMGVTRDTCIKHYTSGDMSAVPESDAILARLEDKFQYRSNGIRVVDSVAGGVPNVPAVLAGHPMSMRRRQRTQSPLAPLTVVVDLTSSAALDSKKLIPRGIAVLALIRLLTSRRPISLYVGVGLSGGRDGYKGHAVFFRMDTTPIDLGRAAFMFTCPGVARGLGYNWLQEKRGATGSWPFHSVEKWRSKAQSIMSKVLGEEVLFVPPIFETDDITVKDPDKWLSQMLKAHGGGEEE